MKLTKILTLSGLLALTSVACQDNVLDVSPYGVVGDDTQLNTPENLDKMVIAAYAQLGNDNVFFLPMSMWTFGNLRSGDAYKGGGGTADLADYHFYETFINNTTDRVRTDRAWTTLYISISRVNDALARINAVSEATYPNKKARQGELRFLRGHFYFLLKTIFNRVPYIDETIAIEDRAAVSNVALTPDQLWDKITEDFRQAATLLPVTVSDAGRANQVVAKAYLAKALLYQAYRQADNYSVTTVDAAKLQEVEKLTGEVIAAGRYNLFDDYAKNFLFEFDNGTESMFAIQRSRGDGSPQGRLDWSSVLAYPMDSRYGCCGFHVPSQNLINAYKTNANGLPLLDTYNEAPNLQTPADLQANTVDPRLNHTVAFVGLPYKYRPDLMVQRSWARTPEVYGTNLSMKEVVAFDSPSFARTPPYVTSSKNTILLRYADVLLWRAEALVELGRHIEALPLINQIRERAAKSTARLVMADGKPVANFRISTYQPGVNCTWTQAYARQAVRFERRLELALEGFGYFDLLRWGTAGDFLTNYFMVEKTRRDYLKDGRFTKGRDEYMPIPQNQMNLSKQQYKQNPNW